MWTKEMIVEEAKLFSDRGEFSRESSKAYKAAQKRGLLDEVCSHMTCYYTKWTDELLYATAKKYDSRSDFQKYSQGAYLAAKRFGIFEEVCKHMPKKLNGCIFSDMYMSKGIYFLYKDSEIVYIGKSTSNISGRLTAHLQDKEFDKVIVYEIESDADIALAEIYLILKHNPKYNQESKCEDRLSISVQGISNIMCNEKILEITKEQRDALL